VLRQALDDDGADKLLQLLFLRLLALLRGRLRTRRAPLTSFLLLRLLRGLGGLGGDCGLPLCLCSSDYVGHGDDGGNPLGGGSLPGRPLARLLLRSSLIPGLFIAGDFVANIFLPLAAPELALLVRCLVSEMEVVGVQR
jgi:hypothetical protein